jgi:hypothetical protein
MHKARRTLVLRVFYFAQAFRGERFGNMRALRRIPFWGWLVTVAACGPLGQVATPESTAWVAGDSALLAEHIQVLNAPVVLPRLTGSLGLARAAAYVADRLRTFGVQPALEGRYQLVYPAAVYLPLGASLTQGTVEDTVTFYPGLEFWPDSQSDTGRVTVTELMLCPSTATCPVAEAMMVPFGQYTAEQLACWQAQGCRVVFQVGLLEPSLSKQPLQGLVVMQLTPVAAARLLGWEVDRLLLALANEQPQQLKLRRPVQVHVQGRRETVGALNVLGFVAGKDPVLRHELVIVAAELDGIGLPGSSLVLDGRHMGEGVAAVLELARFYSRLATYWPLPQRSLLFAVWSGARQGHQGLKAYLQQPLWDLHATRQILYLDPQPEDLPALQQLAACYGLKLKPVLLPDSLQREKAVWFQVPSAWQRAYVRIYGTLPLVSPPAPALRLRWALERARALVHAAQTVLLPEVVTLQPAALLLPKRP